MKQIRVKQLDTAEIGLVVRALAHYGHAKRATLTQQEMQQIDKMCQLLWGPVDKKTNINSFAEVAISTPKEISSLKGAREKVLKIVDAGGSVKCPCCTLRATQQKEKFGQAGVVHLITLVARYRLLGHGLDLNLFAPSRTGVATMRHKDIDLLQSCETLGDGNWAPTQKGEDFVFNKLAVPEGVFKYSRKVRGPMPRKVRVTNFLGDKEYKGALECLRGERMINDWLKTLKNKHGKNRYSPVGEIRAETLLFRERNNR